MNARLIGHRKLLVVMVVFIGLLSVFWYLFAARVGQALQDSLAERLSQQVNGRIQIGNVDLSLLGWVRITDVSLYSQQGAVLARVPVVKLQYSWSDLAKGNFDSSRIVAMSAEGAEVWLQEEKTRWNWEGFLKDEPTVSNRFKGKLQIESAKMYCYALLAAKTITEVNGVIDLQAYPDLDIRMKGNIGQSISIGEGNWVNGQFAKIVVQVKDLDLLEFRDSIPATKEVVLEGGKIPVATVTTERDDQGVVKWRTEGEFSGVRLAGKVKVSDCQGQFSGNLDGLQLQNMKLVISGQQTTGQGSLSWPQGHARIDAVLSVPDADPEAFVSGLTVQRPVACQIRIVGPLTAPEVSGSFSIPHAVFSAMPVNKVTGNFRYADPRLVLQGVSAAVYQGTIRAAGEVQTTNQSYELETSGHSLDSSRLTDKDVQGPLDFNGHVSGKGEWAVTQGTFIIRDGNAYGIPFLTMTGHFIKRGAAEAEIADVVMKTAVGTFYPEQLSREVLERVTQQGVPPITEKAIKKEVEENMKKETEKLIPRLFR